MSGLAGSLLGARFFISSGSSGSRTGWLAVGFGRFVAWSAFFHQSGQLGEQGRWAGTRVWQVWRLDGCGAVSRRPRSGEGPTHTQNWNGGLTGLPLGVCVCVCVSPFYLFATVSCTVAHRSSVHIMSHMFSPLPSR